MLWSTGRRRFPAGRLHSMMELNSSVVLVPCWGFTRPSRTFPETMRQMAIIITIWKIGKLRHREAEYWPKLKYLVMEIHSMAALLGLCCTAASCQSPATGTTAVGFHSQVATVTQWGCSPLLPLPFLPPRSPKPLTSLATLLPAMGLSRAGFPPSLLGDNKVSLMVVVMTGKHLAAA